MKSKRRNSVAISQSPVLMEQPKQGIAGALLLQLDETEKKHALHQAVITYRHYITDDTLPLSDK